MASRAFYIRRDMDATLQGTRDLPPQPLEARCPPAYPSPISSPPSSQKQANNVATRQDECGHSTLPYGTGPHGHVDPATSLGSRSFEGSDCTVHQDRRSKPTPNTCLLDPNASRSSYSFGPGFPRTGYSNGDREPSPLNLEAPASQHSPQSLMEETHHLSPWWSGWMDASPTSPHAVGECSREAPASQMNTRDQAYLFPSSVGHGPSRENHLGLDCTLGNDPYAASLGRIRLTPSSSTTTERGSLNSMTAQEDLREPRCIPVRFGPSAGYAHPFPQVQASAPAGRSICRVPDELGSYSPHQTRHMFGAYGQSSSPCGSNLMVPSAQAPGCLSPSPTPSSESATSPPSTPVLCNFCGKKFHGDYRRGNLARHLRQKHGDTEQVYECEEPGCPQNFKRQDARLKHYRKHHAWLAPSPMLPRKL